MNTVFLDTNTILRFTLQDVPDQSRAITHCFSRTKDDGRVYILTSMVAAETSYVLRNVYGMNREQIGEVLERFAGSEEVTLENPPELTLTVKLFRERNIDFVDAYLAARSILEEKDVLSFDRDFDQVDEVRRIDPLDTPVSEN